MQASPLLWAVDPIITKKCPIITKSSNLELFCGIIKKLRI